ncbi:GATOR complex protein wdr59 [Coemansia guatemalensis]|uniref:GATOR complex protein wdr59 n=1 Tax=Coemansia guatemalensis TaxID=2761395 RepID=A0A9W8HNW9_9FUNG|nr:GATOR complex protein wdr59 [Coemansia guatemalensis]
MEPFVEPPAPPERAQEVALPPATPPQLIAPLDADDVRELEQLMAPPPPPKPPVEPPRPPSPPPAPRAGSADAARSPADPAENIWRRLRSNMLGRTATTAGPDAPPPAAPPVPQRRVPARAPPPREAQLWAALQSSSESQTTQGVAEQALAKEEWYKRIENTFSRLHTRMVVRTADAPPAPPAPAALDQWKLEYARILFMWQMDVRAIEVLKCLVDPGLRAMYSQMHSQPSVLRHDNLLRSGNPVAARRDPFGGPWLSCTWCHEYVHGRALICQTCGHGGHQEHMLRWFRSVRKQLVHNGLAPAQHASAPPAAEPLSPVLAADGFSSPDELDALEGSHASGLRLFAASPGGTSPSPSASPANHAFADPAWPSSDGESDDCLRESQCTMLRRELRGAQRGGHGDLDEALAQQSTVPTCPSGCACNCMYESLMIV